MEDCRLTFKLYRRLIWYGKGDDFQRHNIYKVWKFVHINTTFNWVRDESFTTSTFESSLKIIKAVRKKVCSSRKNTKARHRHPSPVKIMVCKVVQDLNDCYLNIDANWIFGTFSFTGNAFISIFAFPLVVFLVSLFTRTRECTLEYKTTNVNFLYGGYLGMLFVRWSTTFQRHILLRFAKLSISFLDILQICWPFLKILNVLPDLSFNIVKSLHSSASLLRYGLVSMFFA